MAKGEAPKPEESIELETVSRADDLGAEDAIVGSATMQAVIQQITGSPELVSEATKLYLARIEADNAFRLAQAEKLKAEAANLNEQTREASHKNTQREQDHAGSRLWRRGARLLGGVFVLASLAVLGREIYNLFKSGSTVQAWPPIYLGVVGIAIMAAPSGVQRVLARFGG